MNSFEVGRQSEFMNEKYSSDGMTPFLQELFQHGVRLTRFEGIPEVYLP